MENKKINNLKDFIIVIPNSISSKLCDTIVNEYSEDEYKDALIVNGSPNKNARNCQTIMLSENNTINKNNEIRKFIDDELFISFGSAIKKYTDIYPCAKIQQDTGYELLKYSIGGFYIEHTDSFKERPRDITCSLILNDNFKGGQFSFFNKKLIYNLNKGDAILFPSNFMFPHAVLPVTNGIRYAIVTWFL
jgi:predicted 2-oxoglutarate/Fe(II)-dependent dioxygenase YbiX